MSGILNLGTGVPDHGLVIKTLHKRLKITRRAQAQGRRQCLATYLIYRRQEHKIGCIGFNAKMLTGRSALSQCWVKPS
ncbi:hypothetical protein N7527_004381 [Penicillium freii]|nr:hypothetical protein N7527_004381 [Penicillium freii]